MNRLDLTGVRFGLLVALHVDAEDAGRRRIKWICRCDCGRHHSTTTNHLRGGSTRSCGCDSSRSKVGERSASRAAAADPKEYLAQRSKKVASGCIEWLAAKTSRGYGAAHFHGRYVIAHRLSYVAHVGPIPALGVVCHSCDNPLCINPEHLWIGSQQDNMNDKVEKCRHSHGAKHGRAKLSEQQAREILTSADSSASIAAKFGVTAEHVQVIRNGVAWKHLRQGVGRA